MERCGPSYGLYQVAHDTLSQAGFGLDYWWSRMNPAFPHLCVAPWGANAVRNTWGPCSQPNEYSTDEPCQLWTLHIVEQGWERVSESYRGLMEYVRRTAPHLCELSEIARVHGGLVWTGRHQPLRSYPSCRE